MDVNFETLSISPEFAGMLTALRAYDEALSLFYRALCRAYGVTRGEEMFNDSIEAFIPGEEVIKKGIGDWLYMKVCENNVKSL